VAGVARPWVRAGWAALAALPCLAYLVAEIDLLGGRLGLPLDDSWIHLQFARNLALGEGLTYNPGELVAGSTAPLWTALLSIGYLLHLPALAWAKALGIACHLVAVAATWRLARELAVPPALARIAAALTATTSVLVWGAVSGMEVPLFAALATAAMALHARERAEPSRRALSLAFFALAALARPEGILLLALAAFDRVVSLRREGGELQLSPPVWRPLLGGLALATLAIVPALLAYQWLGGSPLPTTFGTKAGYSSPGLPRMRYLFDVVGVLAAAQPVATLLAPAGALVLVARVGGRQDRGLLPVFWAGGLPLAYGVLAGQGRGIFGNFGRYFFPLLPVVAVLAALAMAAVAEQLPPRVRLGAASLRWGPPTVALLLVPGLFALAGGAGRYAQNVRDIEEGDVRLARWLAPRLAPQATLAVDDIGAFKYLLPNRVVDLAGIVTPRVHLYAHRSISARRGICPGVLAFVRDARPDYLAIFPRRHPCFSEEEFPPLLRLEVAGNITLADSTIEIRATPWARFPLAAEPPTAAAAKTTESFPATPARR
jgi:hypothetical protein